MTTAQVANIRTGISIYFTPILLGVVGFLLNIQLTDIKTEIAELRKENASKTEILIEIRSRVNELERRVAELEEGRHASRPPHRTTPIQHTYAILSIPPQLIR